MRPAAILRNRMGLTLVASTAVFIGVLALFWPVHLDDYDQYGFRIGCGDGAVADYEQAKSADRQASKSLQQQTPERGTDRVGDCRSATRWRRGWAAPVAVLGIAGLLTALLDRERRPRDWG
jgi:hypothetical protein